MFPIRQAFPFLVLLLLAPAWGFLLGCSQPDVDAVIGPAELAERIGSGSVPVILDVRSPAEFAQGHIPGAVNIPHTKLSSQLGELEDSKSAEIVVYCQSGRRAGLAAEILREAGFSQLRDLSGHMTAWRAGEFPEEK